MRALSLHRRILNKNVEENVVSLSPSGPWFTNAVSALRRLLNPTCKLPIHERFDWGKVFLSIGFLVIIAFPWGYFAATDVTLVHLFEESVGYRYFYSLRLAYGREYPWLPQGQLPNLVYVVVQWGLTLAGYPIDQLLPRIQAFTLWGALPPLVLAAAAYYLLCNSLKGLLLRVIVGIAFALTIYNPRAVLWWTAIPEYVDWVLPIAIGSVAIIARLLTRNRDEAISSRSLVLFGVYCGACAAVKVTFLVFPLAVCGIHAMQNWRPQALLRQAAIVGLVSAATLFAILIAAFGFNIAALKKFLGDFVIFVRSQQTTLGEVVIPWRWLHDLMPQTPLDFSLIIVGAPAAAVLGALSLRSSRNILGILPASISSIAFYAARPYVVSYVETITFAAFSLVVLAMMISHAVPIINTVIVRFVRLLGVTVCCIIGAIYIEDRMPSLVGQSQTAKKLGNSYEAVTGELSSIPGRTAFSPSTITTGFLRWMAAYAKVRQRSSILLGATIATSRASSRIAAATILLSNRSIRRNLTRPSS